MRGWRVVPRVSVAVVLALLPAGCGSTTPGGPVARPHVPATNTPSMPEFGPACAAFPIDPANPGSFQSMARQPVAAAVSANPGLSTMAAAIKNAGLGESLDTSSGLTLFVPANSAFSKMSKPDLDQLMADKDRLKSLVSYHVVPERLPPDRLTGPHKTLGGGTLTAATTSAGTGSHAGTTFTLNNRSSVICGNIPTANATVYVVDTVLTPTP